MCADAVLRKKPERKEREPRVPAGTVRPWTGHVLREGDSALRRAGPAVLEPERARAEPRPCAPRPAPVAVRPTPGFGERAGPPWPRQASATAGEKPPRGPVARKVSGGAAGGVQERKPPRRGRIGQRRRGTGGGRGPAPGRRPSSGGGVRPLSLGTRCRVVLRRGLRRGAPWRRPGG